MPKDFYLKLAKYNREQNAKADGNICKNYDSSAKSERLIAYTPDMDSYYEHLMEFAVWNTKSDGLM